MKDLHRWLAMETGTETGVIEAVGIVIDQVTATRVTTKVITEVVVTEVLTKASCGAIRVTLPRPGDPKAAAHRMTVAGARLLTLQLCFV